jgi:hypothetical protein
MILLHSTRSQILWSQMQHPGGSLLGAGTNLRNVAVCILRRVVRL